MRIRRAGILELQRVIHFVLVVAFVWLAAMPERAAAQGTSGTLPDPISTRELDGYAQRLRLSPQQKKAFQALHDQYKAEFRAMREGEIAEFLKEMRSMNTGMVMPQRKQVEDFFRKMDSINHKIAAVDNRLFDQLTTVLTEEQIGSLPRVKQARQRERYTAQQMMSFTGQQIPDLSEIYLELKIELPAEQAQAVDASMSSYESRLTQALGELHETAGKTMLNMFDALEEAGFSEASMEDPETAQKMGEVMQKIWADLMKAALDKQAEIIDLNQRAYKSIAPMLPVDDSRSLRNRFYQQAYPQSAFALNDHSQFFEAALKIEDLNDEQRQTVAAARDEFRRKIDQLLEQTVASIQEQHDDFSPWDFNSEAAQKHQERIGELQAQALTAVKSATETVQASLGPDLSKKIASQAEAMVAGGGNEQYFETLEAAAVAAQAQAGAAEDHKGDDLDLADQGEFDADQQVWTGDEYVPAEISRRELADYEGRLQLTDEQKAILKDLYKTYQEGFQAIKDKEVAAVTAAVQAIWMQDEKTGQMTGTEQKIDEADRARRLALEAIMRADDAFFSDLEIALLTPEQAPRLKSVRLARQRTIYNRGSASMWYGYNGGNEAGIDLARLVYRQRYSPEQLAAIAAPLEKYELDATESFRAKYHAGLDLNTAHGRWNIEATRAAEEGQNPIEYSTKYQQIVGEASKKVNEANRALSRINREALDAMVAALPAEAAHGLRQAHNEKAFPNVYQDAGALEKSLEQAVKFADLTDDQRRQVEELAAEYRPAYAALCDQMVELSGRSAQPDFSVDFDRDEWAKFQEQQEAMGKLHYDRNELSARARSGLRMVLNEEQIQRLGGLHDPADENNNPYGW